MLFDKLSPNQYVILNQGDVFVDLKKVIHFDEHTILLENKVKFSRKDGTLITKYEGVWAYMNENNIKPL